MSIETPQQSQDPPPEAPARPTKWRPIWRRRWAGSAVLVAALALSALIGTQWVGSSEADAAPAQDGTDVEAVLARVQALEASVGELDKTTTRQQTMIGELEKTTTRQQTMIGDLEAANAAQQEAIEELEATNAAQQEAIDALALAEQENAALRQTLASVSLETVDGHPTLRFDGVNIQLTDGSGETDVPSGESPTGLGNLIIGYNEQMGQELRNGEHNLVVGQGHSYDAYGSVVFGENNAATDDYAVVLGGNQNHAAGIGSAVVAGFDNAAQGPGSVVVGGASNEGLGVYGTVLAGVNNTATGTHTVVAGGQSNQAGGTYSVVSAGLNNVTSGNSSSVTGGSHNEAEGNFSAISGGRANHTFDDNTSITGGAENTTFADEATVVGGSNNSVSTPNEVVAGGQQIICAVEDADRFCGHALIFPTAVTAITQAGADAATIGHSVGIPNANPG